MSRFIKFLFTIGYIAMSWAIFTSDLFVNADEPRRLIIFTLVTVMSFGLFILLRMKK